MRRMAARASWSAEAVTVQVFRTTIPALRRRARSLQSQLLELTFDSGSVGLGSPAAEVLHVEAFHAPNSN